MARDKLTADHYRLVANLLEAEMNVMGPPETCDQTEEEREMLREACSEFRRRATPKRRSKPR